MSLPDPWPERAVKAAVDLVGRGLLGVRTADHAALGMRIPLSAYPVVVETGNRYAAGASTLPPSQLMRVRDSFARLGEIMRLRAAIQQAFAGGPEAGDAPSRRAP